MVHRALLGLLRLPLLKSLLARDHLPQVPRRQRLTTPEVVLSVENYSQTQDTPALCRDAAMQMYAKSEDPLTVFSGLDPSATGYHKDCIAEQERLKDHALSWSNSRLSKLRKAWTSG